MDEEELIERRRREREQLLKKLGGKPEVLTAAAAKPVTPPELKIAMALTQAKAGILDKEIRKLSAKKEKMALKAEDKNGGKIKRERRSTSSSTADSSGSDSSSSRGKRRREKKKRRRSRRRSGSSDSGTSRESEVSVLNSTLLFWLEFFFCIFCRCDFNFFKTVKPASAVAISVRHLYLFNSF